MTVCLLTYIDGLGVWTLRRGVYLLLCLVYDPNMSNGRRSHTESEENKSTTITTKDTIVNV